MTQRFSGAEEKALALLGQGLTPAVVASAVGLSDSRISQLLSEEEFATAVVELKFKHLQAASARDNELDSLEDGLIGKLKQSLPLMFRPMEIVRALQIVNAAKRRGQSAPQQLTQAAPIVNLTMPVKIVNKFTVASNNQVIEAGTAESGMQELLTMQSGTLLNSLAKINAAKLVESERTVIDHEKAQGNDSERQTINSS